MASRYSLVSAVKKYCSSFYENHIEFFSFHVFYLWSFPHTRIPFSSKTKLYSIQRAVLHFLFGLRFTVLL